MGWYDVIDEYGNDARVLVFENQLGGYQAFKEDSQNYFEDENTTGRQLISRYFRNFGAYRYPCGGSRQRGFSFVSGTNEGEYRGFADGGH